MRKQLDELRKEEINLLQDIQRFNNLDSLRNDYSMKYEEMSTTLQELKDKKRVTENVVQDSEKRNQTIKVDNIFSFQFKLQSESFHRAFNVVYD